MLGSYSNENPEIITMERPSKVVFPCNKDNMCLAYLFTCKQFFFLVCNLIKHALTNSSRHHMMVFIGASLGMEKWLLCPFWKVSQFLKSRVKIDF